MIAMSPGSRRRTRTLVRASTLATPTRPGAESALPRLTCANLMDLTLIAPHPGIPVRLHTPRSRHHGVSYSGGLPPAGRVNRVRKPHGGRPAGGHTVRP